MCSLRSRATTDGVKSSFSESFLESTDDETTNDGMIDDRLVRWRGRSRFLRAWRPPHRAARRTQSCVRRRGDSVPDSDRSAARPNPPPQPLPPRSPEEALKAVPDKPVGPSPELAEVLDRLRQVEREVVELKAKQGAVADAPREQKVFAFVESVHLGSVFVGSPTNPRYFAAKVMLVNLTKDAVVLKRDAVKLNFDGQTYAIKNVPDRYQFHSLQIGTQSQQLGKIKLAPETKIPREGRRRCGCCSRTPTGNHIPDLSLDLGMGEPRLVVDINATQRDQLGLAVSRIGPRQSSEWCRCRAPSTA